MGPSDHSRSHAAREQPGESRAAMRAHDDEVGSFRFCRADELLVDRAFSLEEQALGGNLLHAEPLYQNRQGRFEPGPSLGSRLIDGRRRRKNVDQQLGLVFLRKRYGPSQRVLGCGGKIGGMRYPPNTVWQEKRGWGDAAFHIFRLADEGPAT